MRTSRFALALILAAAAAASFADEWSDRFDVIATNRVSMSEAERLHLLFETDWDWRMANSPEFATMQRHPRARAGWTDNSLEAIEYRKSQAVQRLDVLETQVKAWVAARKAG